RARGARRDGNHVKDTEPVVIRSHTGMRYGIVRVERYRLVITDDGPGKAVFSKRIPVKATTQVGLVGLRVVCAALGYFKTFVASQMRHDGFGDLRGNRVFKTQNVCKLLIVLCCPNSSTIVHVEQLKGYAYPFCSPSNSAVKNEVDPEF